MSISELTTKAELFARDFAEDNIARSYLFHSIPHFEESVAAAQALGHEYQLSKEDLEDITVAMWFHDLGFYEGWQDHEKRSAELAAEFLRQNQIGQDRIEKVSAYILATQRAAEPQNLIEEIVRDADTAHIGDKNYFDKLGRLRGEWERNGDKKFTEKEWIKLNLVFLNKHKFYTTLARNKYGDRKRKNLLKLQKQYKNLKDFELNKMEVEGEDPFNSASRKSDRGVETMFRVTLRNHNNLSRIADNKANIMLSINAIMMSIVVSSLAPQLSTNVKLLVPTIILIAVCLISIIMATLSTRPKITSAKYTDEKFLEKRFNILFFGNFYQIPLDKFEWGIKNLMQDEDLLYSSLSKDLYYLGLVLAKKYQYLYYCYNIFMIGLFISAIAFIIALAI
ncbi:MAG: HD family phosphohydrolase [Saprospiraceae bacterium]|nr:HD family phosphohydrolase [Saprospiraceae bacterium]